MSAGEVFMSLTEKIAEEMKNAMKTGDKVRLGALRMLRASIIEFNKSGADREMNEEDELKILNSAAKKRKEAMELYEKGNRMDLYENEKLELAVIEEFLPKQLSDEEVKEAINKIIEASGSSSLKDLGKVMGLAMKELKGKADGKKVQEFVKELLS